MAQLLVVPKNLKRSSFFQIVFLLIHSMLSVLVLNLMLLLLI
jgi:hypothetical protein